MLAERVGSHSLLLTFEHGSDPAMRGTMVFDYELGLFTRVLYPFSPQILVLDVEVGKKLERFVPDSFPELEVVYPSY
ncbi:hypothetical protein QBL02_02530 [Leucobacter sp. UT-8R-CII-1-4]|uniref:hypothetical protein n=1 Tax=Leucobacter sp. UT-8R-CII-1-4 TaxID=3040075 RepID=UPI0024A7AABB|nr:hypothetical protein [Leucobacter sp. UT-8R-CII-1-4]MDI6022415.1 hypothetical protein [Leucobacter sp. UT-8R-CII-1-4]